MTILVHPTFVDTVYRIAELPRLRMFLLLD